MLNLVAPLTGSFRKINAALVFPVGITLYALLHACSVGAIAVTQIYESSDLAETESYTLYGEYVRFKLKDEAIDLVQNEYIADVVELFVFPEENYGADGRGKVTNYWDESDPDWVSNVEYFAKSSDVVRTYKIHDPYDLLSYPYMSSGSSLRPEEALSPGRYGVQVFLYDKYLTPAISSVRSDPFFFRLKALPEGSGHSVNVSIDGIVTFDWDFPLDMKFSLDTFEYRADGYVDPWDIRRVERNTELEKKGRITRSLPPGDYAYVFTNLRINGGTARYTVFNVPEWSSESCSYDGQLNWNSAAYDVYQGDIDGDGAAGDTYFSGKERFVLIHGDVSVPIILPAPQDFVVYRADVGRHVSFGAKCGHEKSQAELAALVASGDAKKIAGKVFSGDITGGNKADLLLDNGLGEAIVVSAVDADVVGTVDTWPSGQTVRLGDVNGDGRADAQLYQGGRFMRYVLADSNGLFDFTPPDLSNITSEAQRDKYSQQVERTIRKTWSEFSQALQGGLYDKAKTYLSVDYHKKLDALVEVLGEEAGEVLAEVESLEPYWISNRLATFLASKPGPDGSAVIYPVTFVVGTDGSWAIKDL